MQGTAAVQHHTMAVVTRDDTTYHIPCLSTASGHFGIAANAYLAALTASSSRTTIAPHRDHALWCFYMLLTPPVVYLSADEAKQATVLCRMNPSSFFVLDNDDDREIRRSVFLSAIDAERAKFCAAPSAPPTAQAAQAAPKAPKKKRVGRARTEEEVKRSRIKHQEVRDRKRAKAAQLQDELIRRAAEGGGALEGYEEAKRRRSCRDMAKALDEALTPLYPDDAERATVLARAGRPHNVNSKRVFVLSDSAKARFFVGLSSQVTREIRQYRTRIGTHPWAQGFSVRHTLRSKRGGRSDDEWLEYETLCWMEFYGADAVRNSGKYQEDLFRRDDAIAAAHVVLSLCTRCARRGHTVTTCSASTAGALLGAVAL
jgi:hypothetical protein